MKTTPDTVTLQPRMQFTPSLISQALSPNIVDTPGFSIKVILKKMKEGWGQGGVGEEFNIISVSLVILPETKTF